MEHYLSHTDYPVLQVIQNGNGPVSITTDTNGMIKVLPLKTINEVVARESKRKAMTTLLTALPEDHLAQFHKMDDAKEMWESIKSRFGGNDKSKKMQKYLLKQQFEGFSMSALEGLHKGFDRFQTLLSQLEIHGVGVLHEDANQKFLRSLPSSWSQVALIMRTKLGLDTLSFDDPNNNLRVFERDVKGTTPSSSNTQNVAFVSATTLAALMIAPQLGYDDLDQINDDDMEEMDLKWQVAMISMRIKKFHKRTGRKLQFDTKDPVELNGIKTAEEEMFGYNGNNARDNGRRPAYQDDSKALVTMDGEDIDWSGHVEEDALNYAMMAYSSSNSGSDNEVKSCSKTCEESYVRLKKLDDEQRDKLGDASVEITAYTLALKKKLLAEALKEKEDLKTIFKNWQNSSKNHSGLLNTQMSANDKFKLGYGDYRYGSILSYEIEVLQSVFKNKESDLENTFFNDRYAVGMHAVPPHMTGNYMPSGPDVEIDYSKFTYGPKQTLVDESDSKPSEYASCESDSSVETTTSMHAPVENALKVICEPKDDPHRAFKDKGIIDSGCSRSMIGNKAHLADYQEFKGGSVAFGGSNGRISGHVNFKNLNKLVKGNLIRGLPSKIFENDHTCVACQKGKQHKASCKAKTVNSMNQPLQILHMDLFGPTSSAYSTTVKSSGDKIKKNTDFKSCEKPVSQVEQIFQEELEKLKRQEKEANDAARKEATHEIQNANTNRTNLLNVVSTPVSIAGPSRAFNDGEPSYPLIPHLEDIYVSLSEGIFTDSSYNDEGVITDFNNLEITMQEEGLDYDEVFALVARIEAIRIFLAFASYTSFIVYQIDVKSAFMYGTIDEEIYVTQPPGFVDPKFPNKRSGYRRGAIDKTLFIKQDKKDIMLVQVYVDDIIFGSTKKSWCDNFEELMKNKFQISSMGELTFFLGLLVKQKEDVLGMISIKKANDVVKLRALIDGKRVVVSEEFIQYDLRLDDVDGMECLPNEEIFTELAHMGYEKPPPKLTFYKAFFSTQWKLLIHTLVENTTSLIDLSSHTNQYTSPALTQKEFANMRRVRTGFSGVETPLFATMLKLKKKRRSKSSGLMRLRKVGTSQKGLNPLLKLLSVLRRMHPNRGRIEAIDADEDITLVDAKTQVDLEVTMTMAQTLIKMKAEKERLLDEQMAKRLHDEEENIDWNVVIEKIQEKHLDNIKKYQSTKRKPISIAQARKNMIVYLKNMAGYKMEHFRSMTYDKGSFKKLQAVEVSGCHSTQDTPIDDPKEMSEENV
nr:hypothetical protein [Tanacetum cinerariifolium]